MDIDIMFINKYGQHIPYKDERLSEYFKELVEDLSNHPIEGCKTDDFSIELMQTQRTGVGEDLYFSYYDHKNGFLVFTDRYGLDYFYEILKSTEMLECFIEANVHLIYHLKEYSEKFRQSLSYNK